MRKVMPAIAYIANQFPSPVEPYVGEEILELRTRGLRVIPASLRPADCSALSAEMQSLAAQTINLRPFRSRLLLRAAWLCLRKARPLAGLLKRVLAQGKESPLRRARALLHTWAGAYYALLLENRGVEHIHAHHGYAASWIAMVAARLLGAGFSMTLHGSDLLLHRAYLDTKLENCRFCLTVSEYNRRHILRQYPGLAPGKVILQRLGVDCVRGFLPLRQTREAADCLVLLCVGRLHAVKNHAFLVRACALLKNRGVHILCLIVGDGPERKALRSLIRTLHLEAEMKLLGPIPRQELDSYYALADVVVLTSRSEGIPLALMEAMALGKVVLAPAITGIPELVRDGQTGFLYRAGSLDDFVERVEMIRVSTAALGPLRHAAREHVLEFFNRAKNLQRFGDLFLEKIAGTTESTCHADSVLQQI